MTIPAASHNHVYERHASNREWYCNICNRWRADIETPVRAALYSKFATHGYHTCGGDHYCAEYVVGICAIAAPIDGE